MTEKQKTVETTALYSRLVTEFYRQPWAITAEKLAEVHEFIEAKEAGLSINLEEFQARVGARSATPARSNVAVLPLFGVISQRMNLMSHFSGGTSTEMFGKDFDAAIKDDSISSVIIEVDSPGGSASGVEELSRKIFEARGTKPITAMVNGQAASAAYWLATAADEVVSTPTGEAGSIGVFTVHKEVSEAQKREGIKTTIIKAGKYKTEGNPFEPLTSEAKEFIQSRVNEFYQTFVSDVGRNRGISSEDVESNFGQGRVFSAREALKRGMIDRIATMEEVLQGFGVGSNAKSVNASADFYKYDLKNKSRSL